MACSTRSRSKPHRNLVSVLRDDCGLTGPKEGCDDCECGACMVLVDGRPVNSCSYLALQAEGKAITTVEGLAAPDGTLSPLQTAFLECGGVQCGFCTPGMLISATALVARNPHPLTMRFGSVSPATCAGAPDTPASSTPSRLLQRLRHNAFSMFATACADAVGSATIRPRAL